MRPWRTDYFENTITQLDDLQIGDQVLFQSALIGAAIEPLWDYPTCLVTDIDSDPDTHRVTAAKLHVQVFNTTEHSYTSFRLLLAQSIDRALTAVQEHIRTRVAARPAVASLEWDTGRSIDDSLLEQVGKLALHLWAPYPVAFDPPGPWWIRVPIDNAIFAGVFEGDVEKALKLMPKAVALTEGEDRLMVENEGAVEHVHLGPGFRPPPAAPGTMLRRNIFVPLFEPAIALPVSEPMFGTTRAKSGWLGFLEAFANDPQPTLSREVQLRPVRADASWIPGLSGDLNVIRVIRPRAIPAP
jgi:hypothetical protein